MISKAFEGTMKGVGEITEGLNQYAMSKINEKSLKKFGAEQFSAHMASVRQQVSSYVQQQAGIGLVSNKDISWGATAKGTVDAANLEYKSRVEAANTEYEGRMARQSGLMKGFTSISSGFMPV